VRAHERKLADRVERFAWGEAFLTPSLPRVHDANFVRVGALPDAVGVPELAREAERLMGTVGVGHRRVNVDDEAAAARVAPSFAERGWEHEQFLVMAWRREADRPPRVDARELDPGELRQAREEGIRDWCDDDELVGQILARADRLLDVTDVRAFAIVADGRPASYAYLYRDGPDTPVAQVEDVATLEPYRGRGFARAVVTAAAEAAASAKLVFLVASAFDWPQHLYRRLGFDAVGTEDRFLKRA
jgi:ribosomal protein S18 acetylase RimI-like enzyme